MKNNIFTTKLFEIILQGNEEDYTGIADQLLTKKSIFLVQQFRDCDINHILEIKWCENFDQNHLITLIYNSLCALNFIHSSGLIHNNLEPKNIKIDESCMVTI
jgi:serine/threonine protein kinase